MKRSAAKILVIGKKGAGKTAYLKFLSNTIKEKGGNIGGFLCLNKRHSLKNEYYLFNLNTNQSWMLACHNFQVQYTIQYGDYYFNPAVFEIGNQILEKSLGCEAIIIDEYGPLEREQKGFFRGIQFLLKNYSGILIIATRPTTLVSLQRLIVSSSKNNNHA
jgi:nucleoside-triphosphatase THEP1